MNRRPSIHSDKGLKYYLIHTNVEDYKDIDDQVKYVGGDNRDFVSKESKKMWGEQSEVCDEPPTCFEDQKLDAIFLDED
tara:strand:- start:175 stop:411 length:237 start_codon:yes stop_codon:yes gene_type:complete